MRLREILWYGAQLALEFCGLFVLEDSKLSEPHFDDEGWARFPQIWVRALWHDVALPIHDASPTLAVNTMGSSGVE